MSIQLKEKTREDYIAQAKELAKIFASDAAERDKSGGTAKAQRDLLRESGLLTILIPKEYGGEGQTWSTVLEIVREFAKADSSIAHLYGYHFLQLVGAHMYATEEQKEYFYRESAKNNWFWGNSFNPLDKRLIGKRSGDQVILNGKKTFSSGSQDADRLILSWVDEHDETSVGAAIIPTTKEGLTVHNDWDAIGQRQTDSGSVTFDNVILQPEEILNQVHVGKTNFADLSAVLSQIIIANVFIGTAEGALEEAKAYTKSKTRPWIASEVEKAQDDPYILRRFGDYWTKLQGAASLVEKANAKVDETWEKDHALTAEERGECVLLTGSANLLAGNVGLEITSGIFELMGARSAANKYGFDRFWRNVRTHTLHNPSEYKRKNIGKWYLLDEYPEHTAYS